MAQRWMDLFQGLQKGQIDFDHGGLIVSARFHNSSDYAIFETVAFDHVKNIIYTGGEAVTFQSDGYRVFLVFEPRSYPRSFQEPYLRDPGEQIPLRWNELEVVELPNRNRILISKEPYISYGSFTIEAPAEGNFAYYIFDNEGQLEKNTEEFINRVLKEDFEVPTKSRAEVMEHFGRNLTIFRKSTAAQS
jgi:hypothetical protein